MAKEVKKQQQKSPHPIKPRRKNLQKKLRRKSPQRNRQLRKSPPQKPQQKALSENIA